MVFIVFICFTLNFGINQSYFIDLLKKDTEAVPQQLRRPYPNIIILFVTVLPSQLLLFFSKKDFIHRFLPQP